MTPLNYNSVDYLPEVRRIATVWLYAQKFGFRDDEIEDIAQQVTIDYWARIEEVRTDISPKALIVWLTRMQALTALKKLRYSNQATMETSLDSMLEDAYDDKAQWLSDTRYSEKHIIDMIDARECIKEKFRQRAYPLAERVWQLVADGHTWAEIADMLNMQTKQIDNLILRERTILKAGNIQPAKPMRLKLPDEETPAQTQNDDNG